MACLLLTILIMCSYFYLISCLPDRTMANKVLPSFLMTCAQIVITELILGLTGLLHVSILIILNTAISLAVLISGYRRSRTGVFATIRQDIMIAKESFSEAMDITNIALLVLVILSYSWVVIAAYYLPLRGVDDLYYHLPPIFEYIQTHTIKLLAIEIRDSFTFPQNAELLFLWPTIFSHSQKMLDSANVPFVLASIVVVYSMLRQFTISVTDSSFAALLYALCPVVIMQAGSNYIDVIVSLFFLLSLYYTVLYIEHQRTVYAFLAGVSIGLVCGMKYTAFFMTIPLQMIILWKMFGHKRRQIPGYCAIVLTLCGWWYLRNSVVMGNPFYPMNFHQPRMGLIGEGSEKSTANFVVNVSKWLLQFPLEDIGVGSYDGGFGLVFWGLGFSSWICVVVYSILACNKINTSKIVVLMQLPIGFLMLQFAPVNMVQYVGRLSLFVVAIGLFSLCLVFELIQDDVYKKNIKMVCVLFSVLSVSLMFVSKMPAYRFNNVDFVRKDGSLPSEYKFPMNTNAIYSVLKHLWYPLDYITMDEMSGVNCYIASNYEYYALSPFYGSKLQNRPIVVGDNVPQKVDAFVYLHYPFRDLFGYISKQDIYYPDTKFTEKEMVTHTDCAVITQTELGCLIMTKAYLNSPVKLKKLRIYYGDTWPEAVTAAETLSPYLQTGVPVVTSNAVAYGLRYLELGKGRMDGVVLVPSGYEEHVAKAQHIIRCYTLDKPLDGYVFEKIATVSILGKYTRIYLNHAK